MRFTAALLFGLVAAEKTSYFQKRQGGGIADIFAQLKPQVEQLDTLVLGYTGGPGDDVVAQSKKIAAQVKTSTGTVNSSPQLDISAASSLVAPVQDFTTTLEKTINDLIAKKQLSVANGIGYKVYNNLEEQLTGATALATAIKSKMPSSLQATADELSGKILDALNKGIAAFKDVAQPGAGAGAGAGAAGASSPGSSTSASGSAGGAGAGLAPLGSSTTVSGSGAGAGTSMSGGMSGMSGSTGSYDASAPQTTSSRGSSPAVFTGAGASFKPASVFGLVAVAAVAFVL